MPRALDKKEYLMLIFFISHRSHMLWPFIWTVSLRWFRWGVTTYVSVQNYQKLSLIIIIYSFLFRAMHAWANCPDTYHRKNLIMVCIAPSTLYDIYLVIRQGFNPKGFYFQNNTKNPDLSYKTVLDYLELFIHINHAILQQNYTGLF